MSSDAFETVDAVFLRLADRQEQRGAESITDIEKVVLLVWHAAGIIGNGGFRYFFECALPLVDTAQAYERIGVEQAAAILRRLREFFPGRHIPDDHEERVAIMSEFYDQNAEVLRQLEIEFCSTDDLMVQQLFGWVRVHRDVFDASDEG